MSLIHEVTDFCAQAYQPHCPRNQCNDCTHPSGKCSGGCLECSRQINFHTLNGRETYDCPNYVYYYTVKYSWKYTSEIMYALKQIGFSKYPQYSVLSLGCGNAPDLMAFDELWLTRTSKSFLYDGYDISNYWQPIHEKIIEHMTSRKNASIQFEVEDVFSALMEEDIRQTPYNIISIDYLLSHFPPESCSNSICVIFDYIITYVMPYRVPDSPFLIIINDIDHRRVRDSFEILIKKLSKAGYVWHRFYWHFKQRNYDYGDGSALYASQDNFFSIPENYKKTFDCAISCTSAQAIIEVQYDYKCKQTN